jgi:hypothetical protein
VRKLSLELPLRIPGGPVEAAVLEEETWRKRVAPVKSIPGYDIPANAYADGWSGCSKCHTIRKP